LQGRAPAEAELVRREAKMLEELKTFAFVLECVPEALATTITEERSIPAIGIGAGAGTAGQVLVLSDLLGLDAKFKPRFARRYLEGGELARDAINRFARDVRSAEFPAREEVLA
jgi:3-methyl-2-oxobutanoate hydroxymethyltransferase